MGKNIIAELEKSNQLIGAIQAVAKTSLDQAFPDNEPPHWAIVIDLLSTMAADEMERLHNELAKIEQ